MDLTEYIIESEVLVWISPTPKNFFISSNKSLCITRRLIWKNRRACHWTLKLLLLATITENEPSASVNPVTNQGLSLKFCIALDWELAPGVSTVTDP